MRNDLRLHDNECLHYINGIAKQIKGNGNEPNNSGLSLIPLYCFQHEHYQSGTYNFGFPRIGKPRARFVLQTIKDLKLKLQNKGSDLIVRSCFTNQETSTPANAVLSIIKQLGIKAISETNKNSQQKCTLILHQEATQEELIIESSLLQLCKNYGITYKTFWGASLYHKDDLTFNTLIREGPKIPDVPDIYTQFRKTVESRTKVRNTFPIPNNLPPLPSGIVSEDLPNETQLFNSTSTLLPTTNTASNISAFPFIGGETAALERLNDYLWGTDAITTYKETRNGLVGTDYSTKFSAWLSIGSLSPRQIYHEVKKYEQSKTANQSTYWVIFELIWRDFFRFVCLKYGTSIFRANGIRGKDVSWKQDLNAFEKWKNGNTGIPFIDANMRELSQTGWMSNRGRQNVASFLVKDLKLDWRLGAEWFESMLIDHDVCSNYGNWNYAAGVGNDPREDRKFNIIKQGLDYDPNGEFIKMWVPEIAQLAESNAKNKGKIHFPWKVNQPDLQKANVQLGVTYPRPFLIAKEWERYYDKSDRKEGRDPKHGQQQGRGMDFYFKPTNKSRIQH